MIINFVWIYISHEKRIWKYKNKRRPPWPSSAYFRPDCLKGHIYSSKFSIVISKHRKPDKLYIMGKPLFQIYHRVGGRKSLQSKKDSERKLIYLKQINNQTYVLRMILSNLIYTINEVKHVKFTSRLIRQDRKIIRKLSGMVV